MPPNKEHKTSYDPKTNTRRSYDIKDTGIRGVGSNWVGVSNAHYTNQNASKGSSGRHSGETSKSSDIYDK